MHTALAMGLCSVLLGLALGMVQPMVMSTCTRSRRSTATARRVGLRLMAINASSVAMPMLFGAAGAVIGIAGVFWVVAPPWRRRHRMAYRLRAAGPGDQSE
jgi:hypothetical protein